MRRERMLSFSFLKSAIRTFDDSAIMFLGRIDLFKTNPLERKYNEQENPDL